MLGWIHARSGARSPTKFLWGAARSANDLVSAIYRTYEQLPEQIQAEIPLELISTLVPDDGEG